MKKIIWSNPVLHPDGELWQLGIRGGTLILRKVKQTKAEKERLEAIQEASDKLEKRIKEKKKK